MAKIKASKPPDAGEDAEKTHTTALKRIYKEKQWETALAASEKLNILFKNCIS